MKFSTILISIFFIFSCTFAAFSWHALATGQDIFRLPYIEKRLTSEVDSIDKRLSSSTPHIKEFHVSSTKEQIEFEAKKDCEYHQAGIMCVRDLLGIVNAESGFNCHWTGDSGKAHGCFQISSKYHKDVTIEQAEDPIFATEWALLYLLRNHYLTSRYWAIQSYNGTPYTDRTIKYLKSVLNYK